MATKLAVTVAVDLDVTAVTLKTAGTLTPENVRGLIAIARRARRMLPSLTVHVDLGRLRAVSPEALQALADAGLSTLRPGPVETRHGSRFLRREGRLAA
ncbi:hypothetical protein M1D88_05225 [Arthrobacter sp. R1-13]